MSESEKSTRSVVGRVVSDKMDKTISVLVVRQVKHRLYKKFMRRSSRFHAHDARNEGRTGDLVRIRQCRPTSKTKTWELVEVIERPA